MDYPIGTAVVGGWSAPFILLSVWPRVLTNPLPDGVTKASPSAPLSAGAPRGVMVLSGRTMNDINNSDLPGLCCVCAFWSIYFNPAVQWYCRLMNNPHSSFAVLAWPFFFSFFSCMCAYVQSLPAPALEPRRCMLAACPFLRHAPVLRLKRNLRLSKLFFFCELLIKASANTILLFLKSISNFFFSVNYGWDLLVMALRLSLLIFLKLYVCAPMQMRQLCFWGRKDWFKLAENDWFSELAFILSSPLFFLPLFHQHLCVPFVLGWSFQE